MPLSDDVLLSFDHDRLAHFEPDEARQALAEQGDVYRPQLIAARWVEQWAENLGQPGYRGDNADFDRGFRQALREVAAHLRQGDFLPTGVLYHETDRP